MRAGTIEALDYDKQVAEAVAEGVISEAEGELLLKARAASMEFIHVDDFDSDDLAAGVGKRDSGKLRSVA